MEAGAGKANSCDPPAPGASGNAGTEGAWSIRSGSSSSEAGGAPCWRGGVNTRTGRPTNTKQVTDMEHGQGAATAVGEKNAQAPSRAARQAGRGAPARRRPRNGQHLLGRRSYGRRRAHAWRRHQPRGTRARAAAAHPAARSRTPTCGGRWRCRRTPPLVRRSPPPRASVAQQPSGRCHGAASVGHVSTRRKRRRSPHVPRGTDEGG